MASKIIIFAMALLLTMPAMAKTYIIQAEGMMCQACAETVTDGFQKLDKNATVTVDLEAQTITVDMDELSISDAKKTLEDRNYKFVAMDIAK